MATTNGPSNPAAGDQQRFIDTVDTEDPEYIKSLQKPANIKEDMHEMERRKRVSQIMNSKEFKNQLEEIIDCQLRTGNSPTSNEALQQITQLLSNASISRTGTSGKTTGAGVQSAPVIPIADIRGVHAHMYSKPEKILRCKLAALYRLVDLYGWTQGIYNHITVRLHQDQEHFLINPFGLMYHEVTASCLIKVNLQGEVVDPGITSLGVNTAGFTLHSAIHSARPDIKCIIHLHTQSTIAVSAMQCGFLPISQEACIVGDVSYHDYAGIVLTKEEGDIIMRKFSEGSKRKVMFLRNHGVVACGDSIEEAWHYAVNVMQACETQVRAISAGGVDNVIRVPEEMKEHVHEIAKRGGGGADSNERKWKVGQLEFEAHMRMLDNSGYRTGYMYANPNVKPELGRIVSDEDVAVPPASQSFVSYEDEMGSPAKAYMMAMKKHEKSKWLNSPNTYSKVEFEETGTQDPKKITKWVQEGPQSPQHHSTPIRIENPNQFIITGTDIKEFKHTQQKIKKDRRGDKITSGPQSRVLDGVTWEEADQQLQDTSGTHDHQVVVGG